MIDYEKTKKALIDEYNDIVGKHNILIKNIDAISNSTLDNRLIRTSFFSILTYFGGVLALPKILNTGISPDLIAPGLLTVSLTLGVLGESLFTKISGYKNRLRNIGIFKTQRDYIAEEARCEIAHTKCHSVMDLIEKAYNDIKSEESICSSLTQIPESSLENTNTNSIPELEKRLAELENLYETKLHEIDIASSQVTLIEQFNRTRSRNIFDSIFKGFYCLTGGMCGGLAVYCMPHIYLYNRSLIDTSLDPNSTFAVSLATGAVCLGYAIKRNSNYKTVFNDLNEELSENKIPSHANKVADSEYHSSLNKAINTAAIIRIELENTRRKIEKLTNTSELKSPKEEKEQTPKVLKKAKQENI